MKATTYLMLLLAWGIACAQGSLEVIELRHTTAERVLPTLRPLLEPGGVMTGQRNQLVVRTSPGNLAELRRVLEVLDRAPRRLMILVRFERADASADAAAEVRGVVSNRGTRIEASARGTRSGGEERVDQRVQVLEGGRAFIDEGVSRPLPLSGGGVQMQDVATGFEVSPRLAGDEVILQVSPQRQSPGARGQAAFLGASTTIRGRLGTWLELAGHENSSGRVDSGIAAHARSATEERRRIWIKVEEVAP
jgi:hypothetical protein